MPFYEHPRNYFCVVPNYTFMRILDVKTNKIGGFCPNLLAQDRVQADRENETQSSQ